MRFPTSTRLSPRQKQLLAYLGSGTVHPVNRLDRDTTGVTIFAKNGYVKSILTETLRVSDIHKTYMAPVFGLLPEQRGIIDLPIDPQLIGALGAAEFARQKALAR